jgi:hypothetical protein
MAGEESQSNNFNRALTLINEAVSMLKSSPGNNENTSKGESNSTNSNGSATTAPTTPSRQVELVRMFPFMRPTVRSTAKPSTSKGAFKPSSHTYPYQRYTPKVSWTHTFICLADKDEKSVLSREEKRILKEAGLGEKKSIFTDKNGSFNHVKSTLEAQFRQLKDVNGVFEILWSGGARRDLEVISMPPIGYNVPYLKDSIGQAIGYIRRVQVNLAKTPINKVFYCLYIAYIRVYIIQIWIINFEYPLPSFGYNLHHPLKIYLF